jgi:hypothetical protein
MSRGKQVSRRKFLADAAAGTAAFTIVPLASMTTNGHAECVMPALQVHYAQQTTAGAHHRL